MLHTRQMETADRDPKTPPADTVLDPPVSIGDDREGCHDGDNPHPAPELPEPSKEDKNQKNAPQHNAQPNP